MRIIAGTARGRRIAAPPGEDTRPTLERVKEGMFSAVHNWLPGAVVLDLFAGSGQLGLEAVSRGASRCVFVEGDRKAAETLTQNISSSGLSERCSVVRGRAESFLAGCRDSFDLVLLDPPYKEAEYADLLSAVAVVCAPAAQVLCESGRAARLPQQAGSLLLEKQYRYGTVLVHRYRNP